MARGAVAEARRTRGRVGASRIAAGGISTNSKHTVPTYTDDAVKKVWQIIKQHKITVVDLKFNDLPGLWQHFSIPVEDVAQSAKEGIWVDGIGFDGSSISWLIRTSPTSCCCLEFTG